MESKSPIQGITRPRNIDSIRHVQAVTFEELRKMRLVSLGESPLLMPSTHKRSQYQFIDQFYYYAVQLFIRLSFLVFFHRTLYTPRLSTSIRIVALVVLLQTIGTWIFYALQCRPLSAFFHPHGNPNAACISSRITYTAPNAVVGTSFPRLLTNPD